MSKPLPDLDAIRHLHKKYAPNKDAYNLIFTHCLIVWEIAENLVQGKNLNIDLDLVKAGCLLHDIGTYPLYRDGWFDKAKYITHGVEGYNILKKEGFGEELCRIASHHTGVGLSRDEIKTQAPPLPHEDLLADTTEERLIMYADKFHSKHPRFNSYESYKKIVSQFGSHKEEMFQKLAEEFGMPNLDILARKYSQPIR